MRSDATQCVHDTQAERESLAERDALLLAAEKEARCRAHARALCTALRADGLHDSALTQAEAEAARKAARKADSRAVVASLLERDAAVAAAEEQAAPSDVDTDDEAHEAEEYDGWQARELARVTRDREEREAAFREREELERLRAMTDEERAEWDRTHPPPVSAAQAAKDKAKWSFMQKYYHKGAFFQSAADDKFGTIGTFEIYSRDFGAATGEDKGTDRSMLPKARRDAGAMRTRAAALTRARAVGCFARLQAMQVRKGTFGRAGQVKWTHLSAEDTSRKRDDAYGTDPSLRDKCALPPPPPPPPVHACGSCLFLVAHALTLPSPFVAPHAVATRMAGANQPLSKPRHLAR